MTTAPPSPAKTSAAITGGLHHLALVTADVARAERFYADLLGLACLRRQEDAHGLRSVWLDLGGEAFLALERADLEGPLRTDAAPGLHCLSLSIARHDRIRVKEMLEDMGYPAVRETAFTFYVRDPDGILVGISHYPYAYSV